MIGFRGWAPFYFCLLTYGNALSLPLRWTLREWQLICEFAAPLQGSSQISRLSCGLPGWHVGLPGCHGALPGCHAALPGCHTEFPGRLSGHTGCHLVILAVILVILADMWHFKAGMRLIKLPILACHSSLWTFFTAFVRLQKPCIDGLTRIFSPFQAFPPIPAVLP